MSIDLFSKNQMEAAFTIIQNRVIWFMRKINRADRSLSLNDNGIFRIFLPENKVWIFKRNFLHDVLLPKGAFIDRLHDDIRTDAVYPLAVAYYKGSITELIDQTCSTIGSVEYCLDGRIIKNRIRTSCLF